MKKFQIVLTSAINENDYIILKTYETLEAAQYMLGWYEVHKHFFNGTFSIEEQN